jgi:hypothetical protein
LCGSQIAKYKEMSELPNNFKNPTVRWEDLPKKTREFTCFLDLVIDETLDSGNEEFAPTYIRCFGRKCHGIIETYINYDLDEINWRCTSCVKSGKISKIFGE